MERIYSSCIRVLSEEAAEFFGVAKNEYAPGNELARARRNLEKGKDFEDRCPAPPAAVYTFFVVFTIVLVFIVLRPLVGILMQNLRLATPEPNKVTSGQALRFPDVWSKFDPDATQYISTRCLVQLVSFVEPPLGARGVDADVHPSSLQILLASNIPVREGGVVHFREVFVGLLERVAYTPVPDEHIRTLR